MTTLLRLMRNMLLHLKTIMPHRKTTCHHNSQSNHHSSQESHLSSRTSHLKTWTLTTTSLTFLISPGIQMTLKMTETRSVASTRFATTSAPASNVLIASIADHVAHLTAAFILLPKAASLADVIVDLNVVFTARTKPSMTAA
jgi:hypothetical protein